MLLPRDKWVALSQMLCHRTREVERRIPLVGGLDSSLGEVCMQVETEIKP